MRNFYYRHIGILCLWFLAFGAFFTLLFTKFIFYQNVVFTDLLNTGLIILIFILLWKFMDRLPGVKRSGSYWKENGKTILSYGNSRIALEHVEELSLSERHAFSMGINLMIQTDQKRIIFLSDDLSDSDDLTDTVFYNMFSQILAENPDLVPEKDLLGKSVRYWYKLPSD